MEDLQLTQDEILSKLALIEEYVKRTNYVFYEPSDTFDSNNTISVQKEAKKMMDFAGFDDYISVITYVDFYGKTGGNIELNDDKEVFIEINKQYKGNDDKTLAVLAHEICHKVLFAKGLYRPITIENEILVDLATVYLGFGKLSLNGCYNREVERDIDFQDGKLNINTTTHKETVGYLSLAQFAIAYCMVCACNGVKKADKMRGLSRFASKQVSSTILYYSVSPVKSKTLKNRLQEIQQVDAQLTNSIVVLEELITRIRKEIQKHHIQYWQDFVGSFNLENDNIVSEKQLLANSVLNKYHAYYNELKDLNGILQHFCRNLIKNNHQHFDLQNVEECLLDIECPHCGFKRAHALKENKRVFRKCPRCDYLFVWDGQPHYTGKNCDWSLLSKIKKYLNNGKAENHVE